jgi:hypothetical protein
MMMRGNDGSRRRGWACGHHGRAARVTHLLASPPDARFKIGRRVGVAFPGEAPPRKAASPALGPAASGDRVRRARRRG